jgi:RNA polymerase sigma-70 factor (ECF subfamily)
MTGNATDAADATQEALLAIVRGLPRFDGRSAFGTWAYRVATNACLDEMRRRKRRPEPVDEETLGSRAAALGSRVESVEGSVVGRVDIDTALMRLPEDFRAAVVLRDLSGFDYAEIAEVLGVPVGTVKSRIARGRALLVGLVGLVEDGNPSDDRKRPTT